MNYEYYLSNIKRFEETYDWLEDDESKSTMEHYLDGHINLTEFPMRDLWNREYVLDQYFPQDIIRLSDNELVVDCGAFTGDTFKNFIQRVYNYEQYYAIEPDERVAQKFEIATRGMKNVIIINKATWDHACMLGFDIGDGCGEVSELQDDNLIEAEKLDNLVKGKITFLKMDIEGAELPTLKGAENLIKYYKPKLAICVYHKRDDLITIPQYLLDSEDTNRILNEMKKDNDDWFYESTLTN